MAETGTARARKIVTVARELLETQGPDALTMRRLADARYPGPVPHKHLPHNTALEPPSSSTVRKGRDRVQAAPRCRGPLSPFVAAYRAFAAAHPHVYRLMTEQPLPRAAAPGLEARAAAPLLHATAAPRAPAPPRLRPRMVMLELNSGADAA